MDSFKLYYATLYSFEDFDTLINKFVDFTYNYETIKNDYCEEGEYIIEGNRMVVGNEEKQTITFTLSDDELKLKFENSTQTYNKIK